MKQNNLLPLWNAITHKIITEDYFHALIIQSGDYIFAFINMYMPQDEHVGITLINVLETYVQSVALDIFLLGGDWNVTLADIDRYSCCIEHKHRLAEHMLSF